MKRKKRTDRKIQFNKFSKKNQLHITFTVCMCFLHCDEFSKCLSWLSLLGLIHTRHFRTQYCDKKIKRHFDKKIFFLKNIVMTFQNIFKAGFNKHNCPKINISIHTGKKYWLKNVFL